MGCAASKGGKKKKKGTKDKKGAKKKSYGKKGSPDALRREITDIYSVYKEEKKKVDPFLAEKFGISAILSDEREKLLGLLAKQDALLKQRYHIRICPCIGLYHTFSGSVDTGEILYITELYYYLHLYIEISSRSIRKQSWNLRNECPHSIRTHYNFVFAETYLPCIHSSFISLFLCF